MFEMLSGKHEPVYLNEGTSHSELVLQKMEALRSVVSSEDREKLEEDIRMAKAGIIGEKKIVFELMNSHYPLVFIHDLNLELDGLTAQIDFFVVTPYNIIIIECKHLFGNITIEDDGSFVREYWNGKYRKREGIYSPVAQNKRHLELIKAAARSNRGTFYRFVQQFTFDDYYHSLIVLANEKTVLDASHAPKTIRDQVVRVDQLVDRIKRLDKQFSRKNPRESYKEQMARANDWKSRNIPIPVDLSKRYVIIDSRLEVSAASAMDQRGVIANSHDPRVPQGTRSPTCPLCGATMVLRTARYGKNKGNKFWGCSRYAQNHCKGIIPYRAE